MKKKFIVATLAAAAMTTSVFATHGINLIGIGPVQQGTAGAGVASAKDSTWFILNPAGLADIKPSFDASLQIFAPNRSLDSTVSGASKQTDDSIFFIPQISGSFGCCAGNGRGYVGLGMYGTSGMGVDYGYGRFGTPMGPQKEYDKMTELSIAKMTATYAYRFEHGINVGAGPVLVISRFRTDMVYGMTPTGPLYGNEDWDTSYGGGAIFGITKHFERFSVAGSYMSKQWMSKFDNYQGMMPDSLNLPQQATVGVAFNVLDNLELVCDYQWIDWSGVDTFDRFGWDSQNIFKVGATWMPTEALTLRTGVSYGKSPVDGSNAFSNGLFPAIMETHFACGLSYNWEKWVATVAYIHAFENSVTAGDDLNMGPMGKGTKLEMYQNSLTVGVTRHF